MATQTGYYATAPSGGAVRAFIVICHQCTRPTFFDTTGRQHPGSTFGTHVDGITDALVATIYEEARGCTGAGHYTAAVLCCRKLLMHIAVSKGAEPNQAFVAYVEFLANRNYIPPDARDWVDHIRKKGNEATHEIRLMAKEDAEDLVSFSGMLLKVIYEFPAAIKKRLGTP